MGSRPDPRLMEQDWGTCGVLTHEHPNPTSRKQLYSWLGYVELDKMNASDFKEEIIKGSYLILSW